MPDTTHGPPVQAKLEALHGHGFDKYELIKDRLKREPIELIHEMRTGGYRYKSRRGKPGVLVLRRGAPVEDRMSLRQISEELERLTGAEVAHETVRRWWVAAFPEGEPLPVEPYAGPVKAARQARRAVKKQVKPAIPPAVFMPPTE